MKLAVNCLWQPKAGNTATEYEDAYFPKRSGEINGGMCNFAVADGASEGMLNGKWAEILVKCFCKKKHFTSHAEAALHDAYTTWDKAAANYRKKRERQARPLQWYEEQLLGVGAFASLLRLTLKEDKNRRYWEAFAVGDACLFQVRDQKELVASFPMETSADFNNRPFLISSNTEKNVGLPDNFKHTGGHWEAADMFYLTTDALACWFLQAHESGEAPWLALDNLNLDKRVGERAFGGWIDDLRKKKLLRNDDVTLICIGITECEE